MTSFFTAEQEARVREIARGERGLRVAAVVPNERSAELLRSGVSRALSGELLQRDPNAPPNGGPCDA